MLCYKVSCYFSVKVGCVLTHVVSLHPHFLPHSPRHCRRVMASLIRARLAASTSSQWEDGDWDEDSWVRGEAEGRLGHTAGFETERVHGKRSLAALVPAGAGVEERECNLTTGEGEGAPGSGLRSQGRECAALKSSAGPSLPPHLEEEGDHL